jgi:drug/metabolite transporter (DMT)-like permease
MIVELSVLAALGAMLCWGFADFFIQRSTRAVGSLECLAFLGIMDLLILLPFALPELPLLFSPSNIALLALIGIFTIASGLLNLEALRQGKLSVIEIIFVIELPVTVILGMYFFGELLSLPQIAAIAILLAGIALISFTSISGRPGLKGLEKGVLLAAIAAVSGGFLNFFTAAGSRLVSPVMAIWLPALVFTAICLVLIWSRKGFQKFAQNAKKFKFALVEMGFFSTAAWLLFAFAVLQKELAITVAITESYPAVAMLLGVFVNKEKITRHQYAGAAIALLASIALAFLL